MQIFVMTEFANDLEYRSKIKAIIDRISENAGDDVAEHMPIMPDELTLTIADSFVNNDVDIYVGIETSSVKKDGFTIEESPVIILGNEGSGKTNLLKLFIHQMK